MATYRYIKWEITKKYGESNGIIQVGELQLMSGGYDIAWNGSVVAINPGGSNPTPEGPQNAVDGTADTKWLDLNFSGGSNIGSSVLVVDNSVDITFDSYYYVTAVDSTIYPDRNPISWTLYGSSDGSSWAALHSVNDATIPAFDQTPTSIFSLVAATPTPTPTPTETPTPTPTPLECSSYTVVFGQNDYDNTVGNTHIANHTMYVHYTNCTGDSVTSTFTSVDTFLNAICVKTGTTPTISLWKSDQPWYAHDSSVTIDDLSCVDPTPTPTPTPTDTPTPTPTPTDTPTPTPTPTDTPTPTPTDTPTPTPSPTPTLYNLAIDPILPGDAIFSPVQEVVSPYNYTFQAGDKVWLDASEKKYSFDYYEIRYPITIENSHFWFVTNRGFTASFDPRTQVNLNHDGDIVGTKSLIIARYIA